MARPEKGIDPTQFDRVLVRLTDAAYKLGGSLEVALKLAQENRVNVLEDWSGEKCILPSDAYRLAAIHAGRVAQAEQRATAFERWRDRRRLEHEQRSREQAMHEVEELEHVHRRVRTWSSPPTL